MFVLAFLCPLLQFSFSGDRNLAKWVDKVGLTLNGALLHNLDKAINNYVVFAIMEPLKHVCSSFYKVLTVCIKTIFSDLWPQITITRKRKWTFPSFVIVPSEE